MQPEQQQRIMGYFIEEAKDHLNTIEQGLLNLQSTLDDPEMVNEVFRAAHSVKGGAAMLNLGGIQKTSHRLEDYFKVLKETPGIRADQKLESLLLQVFDVLQNLLEQLQGPYGLTEDVSLTAMTEAEPTFNQIEQHLQSLVATAGQAGGRSSQDRDRRLGAIFQQQVPTQLREMLELFRQADAQPEARQRLQSLCDGLKDVGQPFELSGWCELLEAAKGAISYSANACRDLAPIIIRELKQAQEAIVAGRGDQIQVSDQLLQLLPLAASETMTDEAFGEDLFAADMDALLAADGLDADLEALDLTSETADLDFLSQDFDTESLDLASLSLENEDASLAASEAVSEDAALLSLGLDDLATDDRDLLAALEEDGPEMGMAELNSLADLFEGEVPDLSSTWQEEEVLNHRDLALPEEPHTAAGAGEDLSDLLLVVDSDPAALSDHSDELSSLFGENFLDDLAQDEAQPIGSAAADLADLADGGRSDLAGSDLAELDMLGDLELGSFDLGDDREEVPAEDSFASDELGLDALGLDVLDSFEADLATEADLAAPSDLDFSDAFSADDGAAEPIEGLGDLFTGLEDEAGLELSQEAVGFALDEDLSLGLDGDADLLSILGPELEPAAIEAATGDEDLSLELELPASEAASEASGLEPLDLELPDELGDLGELHDPWDGGADLLAADTGTDLDLDLSLSESSDSLNLSAFEALGDEAAPEELAGFDLAEPELIEPMDELSALDADVILSEASLASAFPEPAEAADLFSLNLEGATDDGLFDELTLMDEPAASSPDIFLGLEASGGTDTEVQVAELELPEVPSEEALEMPGLDSEALEDEFDLDLMSSLSEASEADFSLDADLDDLSLESMAEETPDPFAIADLDDLGDLDALDLATEPLALEEVAPDQSLDLLSLDDLETEAAIDAALDIPEAPEAADSDLLWDLEAELPLEAPAEDTAENTVDLLDLNELDFEPLSLEPIEESLPSNGVASEAIDLGLDTEFNLDDQADDLLGEWNLDSEETSNPDLALEDLSPWDDLDQSEALTETSTDRTGDVEAFDDLFAADTDLAIASSPEEVSEESSLEDFEGLFGVGAAGALGLGVVGAAAMGGFSGETETAEESSLTAGDFADLEALIGEETEVSGAETSDFADLEALLGLEESRAAAPEPDAEQFADLEALLSSDAAEEAELSTSYSEFDDLEKLLEDGDKSISGAAPASKGLGVTQARRPSRPNKGFSEQTMRVPVKHLDNLSNLVGELVVNRNSLEQDQERLRQSLDNLLYQVQQLSDVGQRMQDLYERSLLESSLLASRQNYRVAGSLSLQAAAGGDSSHANDVEYDPLEMDRFTGFHSLSQEMIELIVRVRESASDIEFIVDETDQVTRMFRQVTTQLQEGLTRSRMVPFAQTADRLPRAVRDIAMKCGKQAELVIEGRETLIDKMILEHLYDPMTHLVNNAITHGIETPEERRQAGKPETGRILIRAFHQGNQTVISVADDGAGIELTFDGNLVDYHGFHG